MWLGKQIKINGKIGTVVKENGDYVLIKFNNGQFVFNKLKISNKQIIND